MTPLPFYPFTVRHLLFPIGGPNRGTTLLGEGGGRESIIFPKPQSRVSITIEVASRFELSTQLYQQGGINPIPLGGACRHAPSENFEISKPLNAISSILGTKLSTKESVFHSRKCSFHSGSDYQPHNLQAMKKRTFQREEILCKPPKKCEKLTARNTAFT